MSSHALLPLLLASFATGDDSRRPLSDGPRFVAEAKAFATATLSGLEVLPGFGLAVVVDGKVLVADGFGLADRERSLRADGDTLYYIASATKPFTALMASLLDARGDLELGSALADYLDEGQLDPKLGAEQILLRDLLCHTSGLENGPITFRLAYSGEHDPATLWSLVGRSTANSVGRGRFQYTNYGYNLLTIVMERELGKRWQDLLQDELFTPLGLTHTSAYVSVPRAKGFTLAAPYRLDPAGVRRVALEKSDAQMQSAGGMVMSPRDAARWLAFQLGEGVLDGKAVVDPELVRATQGEWAKTGEGGGGEGASAVGGGWMISERAGQRLLQHGGGYPGFRSTLSFMPDARVGVAVFVNGDIGADVTSAVRDWVYDWWLGRDAGGGAARIAALVADRDRARAGMAQTLEQFAARKWQLSRERKAYAGTFTNEALGTLTIEVAGESFRARLGLLECLATPGPSPETIRFELIPGSGVAVLHEFDASGRATALNYDGERFVRRAE